MNRNRLAARAARLPIAAAFCLLAVAGFGGCGDTAAPVAADPGLARKTLDRTLDAWREGRTVAAMSKANPSVAISDSKWERGDALKKYEVKSEGAPSGAERIFTVQIWLTDAQGKETTEEVRYRVGTDPVQTVFRAMF